MDKRDCREVMKMPKIPCKMGELCGESHGVSSEHLETVTEDFVKDNFYEDGNVLLIRFKLPDGSHYFAESRTDAIMGKIETCFAQKRKISNMIVPRKDK